MNKRPKHVAQILKSRLHPIISIVYCAGFHFIIVCTTVQWALQQQSILLQGRKCFEIRCKVVYFASWSTATCSSRKNDTAPQLLLAVYGYNGVFKPNLKCVNVCVTAFAGAPEVGEWFCYQLFHDKTRISNSCSFNSRHQVKSFLRS